MEDLNIRPISFHPGMVARRTGKDHFFHILLFHYFQMVLDQNLRLLFHPRANQGKTTAPLLSSGECEINSNLVRYVNEGQGDLLYEREKGANAAYKKGHFGFLFLIMMIREFIEKFQPLCPLVVFITGDIVGSFIRLRRRPRVLPVNECN